MWVASDTPCTREQGGPVEVFKCHRLWEKDHQPSGNRPGRRWSRVGGLFKLERLGYRRKFPEISWGGIFRGETVLAVGFALKGLQHKICFIKLISHQSSHKGNSTEFSLGLENKLRIWGCIRPRTKGRLRAQAGLGTLISLNSVRGKAP